MTRELTTFNFIFRIALAEQEARTELLRKRAKQQRIDDIPSTSSLPESSSSSLVADSDVPRTHINFFKAEEEGQKYGGNAEYAAEKKEEKEKFEKSIGLLTYLGQSALEAQQATPWYFQPREKSRGSHDEKSSKSKKEEYDRKRKSDLDPMKDMVKYLDVKKKHKKHKDKDRDPKDRYGYSTHDKHHKKQKQDRDSVAMPPSSTTFGSSSGKKTIEQLRAERLKREREERKRTEELLARARGEKPPEKEKVVVDERERTYNSQFNPEFVRKPKRRDNYY